jgi:hypothetical protein
LAERDLHPTVIARKVSFGSSSDAGSKTRSVLMSVLHTLNKPDSCKTDTGKPPFKASEGGCFENLRVSEDITLSEFQQGKGTRVPIRPKVRLEASPNGLPMSVSSKLYATLR